MSFLDHLRQKWKHSDPAVREEAVRDLDDQELLERIALDDPDEIVRLAAVGRLTDQDALARFARGRDALATLAAQRLTEPALLAGVAQFSESRDVRELAVGRITDRAVLQRIATSDTDSEIRWLARSRGIGFEDTREVLRSELSKLELAQRKLEQVSEFCGTLDDLCAALVRDGRFRINGAVESGERGLATIRELASSSPPSPAPAGDAAASPAPAFRLLAAKRETRVSDTTSTAQAFYEISVWRTEENTFHCQTRERRLDVVPNSLIWGRVSNGATDGAIARSSSANDRGTGTR